MHIGPLEIRWRQKAAPGQLASVETRGGWWPIIRESYAGAWQSNVEVTLTDVTRSAAVFACIGLIASDIAKMRLRLVALDDKGIWSDAETPAYSPVLRRPNRYQHRIKFVEQWVISKLLNGNTYVLKQRDNRSVVTALYILDPSRVRPLVAPDGAVYYELKRDDLSQLPQDVVVVPAREIIHDIGIALFHPLVGVSPIYASGIAAIQGLRIQESSTNLFANGANPGGVLTAPGAISQATADRLKAYWEANYTGSNVGKVAVLGDGLKFEKMVLTGVEAQLIEQLKWTAENICTAYRVPPYMIGVGPPPNYNNIEALNAQYYAQCLQEKIECIELCLDEGLELIKPYGTEFDTSDLLRMDSATKMTVVTNGIKGGVFTPNEGRLEFNKPPLTGGDTVYLQEQDHALEWLSRRDKQPIQSTSTPVAALEAGDGAAADEEDERQAAAFAAALFKGMAELRAG